MTASRSVRGMGDRCVFTELFLTWLLLHQTFRCPWPRLARLPLTLGRRGLMLPGRLVLRPVPTPRSAPGAPPWGRSQYRARRGLGEMDPKVLAETTLDPRHRTLLQVQIDSNLETDKTFVDLLGKDPSQRYRFIMDKAARAVAEELDV